jgi:hypothetical protein
MTSSDAVPEPLINLGREAVKALASTGDMTAFRGLAFRNEARDALFNPLPSYEKAKERSLLKRGRAAANLLKRIFLPYGRRVVPSEIQISARQAGDADAASPGATADPRRWLILAVVALAQLMVVLDATIVNIALPSAQHARCTSPTSSGSG